MWKWVYNMGLSNVTLFPPVIKQYGKLSCLCNLCLSKVEMCVLDPVYTQTPYDFSIDLLIIIFCHLRVNDAV